MATRPTEEEHDDEAPSAASFVPKKPTASSLKLASSKCRGCPLFRNATQTVFGEGPKGAALFFIGEQPGDVEDREGKPFVGPAGGILARALEDAGISRDEVYVTNAVKHFKFVRQGKRRLHQRPTAGEVERCRPWLDAEIGVVKPAVLICLGATAVRTVLGPKFHLTQRRGALVESPRYELPTVATWHPSNVLRMRERPDRERVYEELVNDLRAAHGAARRPGH